MHMQPAQTDFRSGFRPAHIHPDGDTCPTCEQAIPLDKLEEISGRIALRQHEHEQSIRIALEERFKSERAQASAEAATALEEERRRAAADLAAAREQDREAADAQKQAAVDALAAQHAETQAQLIAERDVAHADRRNALQANHELTSKLDTLRAEGEAALVAERDAAAAREQEIRAVARQEADQAAATRLEAVSATLGQEKLALQESLDRANEAHAKLQTSLDETTAARVADIERLTAEAAASAERVKSQTAEAVRREYDAKIVEKDDALQAATSRAVNAEGHAASLSQQFLEQLATQREALEKDKDVAVSAEKARSFEETQKLSNKVGELQRALDKKTNEELGEGAEVVLYEDLKSAFPDDDIQRVNKGQPGADVIHKVMLNRKVCGIIVYDSKNHKAPRADHIAKLRTDQLAASADHAILSSHKILGGYRQIHLQEGIVIANPARVVILATILRNHILQVHTLRISAAERQSKTVALYDFMTSDRFKQFTDRIDDCADSLLKMQEAEVKAHQLHWKKEGELYRTLQKTNAALLHEVSGIIGIGAEDDDVAVTESAAEGSA